MKALPEYTHFVTAHKGAAKLCAPMFDRVRTSLRSKHPEVVAARGKVEEARLNFEKEPTVEKCRELNEAKHLPFNTFDTIKGEELMESVLRVLAAQGEEEYCMVRSGGSSKKFWAGRGPRRDR